MPRRRNNDYLTKKMFREKGGQGRLFDKSYEEELEEEREVECLGKTFESDEARREYFLRKLREGLEEIHEKVGGVPFTTVDDAVTRMKSIEKWPMGDSDRLQELAQRMKEAAKCRSGERGKGGNGEREKGRNGERQKDLLQLWKDEIGFPHGELEDVLNLSDPPYYTACPNPFIEDFIIHHGKSYDPNVPYSREPFAVDVSEGKDR